MIFSTCVILSFCPLVLVHPRRILWCIGCRLVCRYPSRRISPLLFVCVLWICRSSASSCYLLVQDRYLLLLWSLETLTIRGSLRLPVQHLLVVATLGWMHLQTQFCLALISSMHVPFELVWILRRSQRRSILAGCWVDVCRSSIGFIYLYDLGLVKHANLASTYRVLLGYAWCLLLRCILWYPVLSRHDPTCGRCISQL